MQGYHDENFQTLTPQGATQVQVDPNEEKLKYVEIFVLMVSDEYMLYDKLVSK